jgi:C4-dicarboxylate-specific signal transduction histidine kinase
MDALSQVTAIGTMGSALAHEISQPVASIFTYARACQLLLDKGPEARARLSETLAKIGAEAERAGQVLRNMRNMLAEVTAVHERLDPDAVIARAVDIVQREPAAASVGIVSDLRPLPRIAGNPRHIEQVLINILRNAVEATAAASPGGEVRVSALPRGRFVEIAIDDSGGGIPPEVEATLFEPFVTTKPLGLGLGLAISRKLAELCGGDISVFPRKGGTRFVIRLPAEEA